MRFPCTVYRVRSRSMKTFFWIIASFILGIECCENQTNILCRYSKSRQEVCNNALCNCALLNAAYSRYIVCEGVLSEIPIGQFQETMDFATVRYNNITTLRNGTFSGLFIDTLWLDKNTINTIESSAFENVKSIRFLDLSYNFITAIQKRTFKNIPNLAYLHLNNNLITKIGQQAFMNMPTITNIFLYSNFIEEIESEAFKNIVDASHIILAGSPVKRIESYAFSDIRSDKLEINMNEAMLQRIEKNVFYNVTAKTLVLKVNDDLSFEENFVESHFNNTYFVQPITCNCTTMWISLWLQDHNNRRSTKQSAPCNDLQFTPLYNLTMDYFSDCREMSERYECRETEAVIINCSLSFISGDFIEWIHSRNGKHIRTLKTLTNILSIPYCSLDDIGDYTCVRSTLYSAAPYINITTTLHVKGKPVIINHQTYRDGADLVLSVTIFTSDDVDIQWILHGINLTNDADYNINTSVVPITLTQYDTLLEVGGFITNLTIRSFNSLSTRAYTCRISNEIGTVEEVLWSRPIEIYLQPNILCDISSRLEIDCTLNADGTTPKYFQHTVSGKLIRTLIGSRVNNTYTLVIPFCNSQDLGNYTCYWDTVVPGMEVISKTTALTVNGPPIILYHTETAIDKFIILSVMFISTPYPMEPQWFYNDVSIVPSSKIQQTTSISAVEVELHRVTANVNGFISNLTIKEEQATFGDYKCVVKNGYGTTLITITRNEGLSSRSKKTDDSLPVILGSGAAGVLIIIILIVVFVKRIQRKTHESGTYTESTDRYSNNADTYDTIRMSSTTMEHDYVEIME